MGSDEWEGVSPTHNVIVKHEVANGKSFFFEIGVAWLGEAQGTSMTLRFHPLVDLSRIAPGSYVYVKPRNTRAK